MENKSALLKFGTARATRMTEAEALAKLASLGLERGPIIRHSIARDGRRETIVWQFYGTTPEYPNAHLTVTFAI